MKVDFPKEFLLKFKAEYNVSHFIPVGVKKEIQNISLEYGLFSQIIKIKRTVIAEADKSSNNKIIKHKSLKQTSLQKRK